MKLLKVKSERDINHLASSFRHVFVFSTSQVTMQDITKKYVFYLLKPSKGVFFSSSMTYASQPQQNIFC